MARRPGCCCALAGAIDSRRARAAKAPTVTVMTRNLYLGADLIPLATTPPGPGFNQAATNMFAGVQSEDPNGRMKLVADDVQGVGHGARR